MGLSLSGLSGSGLNTTEIVQSLMEVEKIPYTNLESKKSQLQTEQAVFRQINTKLNTLDNALFDLKYSFNLKAYKATSSSDSLTASASDSAIPGKYKVQVKQAAEAATAKTTGTDFLSAIRSGDLKLGNIDFSNSSLRSSLKIDETTNDEQLLNSVVSYINANSKDAESTITMLKKDDGGYAIDFTSNNSSEVNITSNTLVEGVNLTKTEGKQAEFIVNGETFKRDSNSITDVIPGVTFTISDDTEANTLSTITISADSSKIADKVQTFVNAYNDLISNVRLNLAKPEDDDSINPLQGDTLLKDINSRLYSIFNEKTTAGFMEEIGLSIDKGVTKGSSMTGKITFDRDIFTTALTENPSKVNTTLTEISTTMSNTISKSWTSYATGVMSSKITGYDAELKLTDERLEAMDRALQMKEARLKSQFNSMEMMLLSLNNTQSWLSTQFSTLNKSSD